MVAVRSSLSEDSTLLFQAANYTGRNSSRRVPVIGACLILLKTRGEIIFLTLIVLLTVMYVGNMLLLLSVQAAWCFDVKLFIQTLHKAANPGCILEDFVKWRSPSDWMENETSGELDDTSDGGDLSPIKGQLSRRMQKEDVGLKSLKELLYLIMRYVSTYEQPTLLLFMLKLEEQCMKYQLLHLAMNNLPE